MNTDVIWDVSEQNFGFNLVIRGLDMISASIKLWRGEGRRKVISTVEFEIRISHRHSRDLYLKLTPSNYVFLHIKIPYRTYSVEFLLLIKWKQYRVTIGLYESHEKKRWVHNKTS